MFWQKPKNPYIREEKGGVYHLRVRTPSGDVVAVRFTQSAHIARNDDESGYFFRKPLLSSPHLDKAEVLVTFDGRYKVLGAEAQGGELVAVAEWE